MLFLSFVFGFIGKEILEEFLKPCILDGSFTPIVELTPEVALIANRVQDTDVTEDEVGY